MSPISRSINAQANFAGKMEASNDYLTSLSLSELLHKNEENKSTLLGGTNQGL